MKCLWLSRYLPFPLLAGDRIYSARLAAALAAAGTNVTFAGLAGEAEQPAVPGLRWCLVPGQPRSTARALASPMPLVAGRYATPAYAASVAALAGQPWDAVILDQYAMGWALRHRASFGEAVFVFIAHDHEESVTGLQAGDPTASAARRLYLRQNYLKTRWHERRTARRCDLVTTITAADANRFEANAPGLRTLVLTPGYDGPCLARRVIGPDTPRMVLVLGAFHWSAKQANLRIFLDLADAKLAAAGIELRVVGTMPADFRRQIEGRYRSLRVTGYVDDPAPHLAEARLAVVAEPIGGGFKLKLLDYLFQRIPIASLDACAAGLPEAMQAEMLLRPDIGSLVQAVIEAVDDLPRLNRMQDQAHAAAAGAFRWADRGEALHDAIAGLRQATPGRLRLRPEAAIPAAASPQRHMQEADR